MSVQLKVLQDGKVELQRRNMLVLPESVVAYTQNSACNHWHPHAIELEQPDWAINNCTDADTFQDAIDWLEHFTCEGTPIFNSPYALRQSSRDRQFELFGDIEGLTVPKTVRFKFETTKDLQKVFQKNDFVFPVLVRPLGFQTSIGMHKVNSADDWERLVYTRWHGQDHAMIAFEDTQTSEELYLKVRVTFVGSKPFLRHCHAAKEWLVQGPTNIFKRSEPALEIALIDQLEDHSGFMEICRQIGARSGLDLFGADIGFNIETGKFVLFEANASMTMFFPFREGMTEAQLIRRDRLQTPAAEYLLTYIQEPNSWRNISSNQGN